MMRSEPDRKISLLSHAGDHGKANRDNNIRAAVIDVVADAAVSFLVIVGLVARPFGWLWMDPLAPSLFAQHFRPSVPQRRCLPSSAFSEAGTILSADPIRR